MRLVIMMSIIASLEALHCDKEFNFDDYEKGYDITCQGLTKNYTTLLQNINIFNERSLKMDNCTLTEVSSDLFQNVRNIKRLDIENSTFTFAQTEHIFENLNKLEQLRVINTKFQITRSTLSNLLNLKELTLKNNKLNNIEKESFKDLSKLSRLEITNNNLTDIVNAPLCELKGLKVLNLSRNSINKLDQIFYCVVAEPPPLLEINNSKRRIKSQKNYNTISSAATELYQIDLSFNNIHDISSSFAFIKSLKLIRLNFNKLSRINDSYFKFLEYLEDLQINNNVISIVENGTFKNKRYLENVDLSNNKIRFVNLGYLTNVTYLNLGHNELDVKTVLTISNINRLETFLLYNNNITDLQPNTFDKYIYLKQLDLSKNCIKLVDGCFRGLLNLTHLSISNNSIETIPRKLFEGLKSLKVLDLSENKLTVIQYKETFTALRNLEILNLASNHLTYLNHVEFENLKNLKVFDISHNKLINIDYDIIMSHLPGLELLNIKYNDFSCALVSQIITYLKTKGVSYSVRQIDVNTDKVNVEGIYCRNEKTETTKPPDTHVMFNITLGLIIVLVIVILGILIFKINIYLKRRKYRADEFELIEE